MRLTKFIIFVLVIAQALCGSASAQSVMAHTLTPFGVEHVIVKSYTYPATITSCNFSNPDTLRSMFIYSGANHKSIQVILDGYRINDFAIDNDTVFFCGQSRDTLGIIGFFSIQDLFFNSGTFRIQPNFCVSGNNSTYIPVENLTKMVTYNRNNQKRHIVCIGYAKDTFQIGLHYCCIVDMHLDTRRPISPWSYESGTIHGSDSNFFKDITIAGNYVITAGFEYLHFISMRLFKADDIFSITGPQNSARIFNGSTQWKTQDLLLTTLSNGALPSIATAAVWDINYSATYKPIHIATYDVSQLVTGSPSSMTGSAVMNVSYFNKYKRLYDFIADHSNNRFVLVHLGENSSSQECSIISKININLQTVSKSILANSYCLKKQHRGLQSIDKYNSNTQYVFAGLLSNDNRELTYEVETSGSLSMCEPDTSAVICSSTLVNAIKHDNNICEMGGITGILFVPRYDTLVLPIIIECNQ